MVGFVNGLTLCGDWEGSAQIDLREGTGATGTIGPGMLTCECGCEHILKRAFPIDELVLLQCPACYRYLATRS